MAVNPHLKVYELINNAVGHQLSVPEFQRGFVWKPTQVRDLAESLWLKYPIGSVLIWDSEGGVEERIASDAKKPGLWIVDGQQRTAALCILFGRKPYWWPSAEDWEKTIKRYDIRFDIEAIEAPYFWTANAAIRRTKGDRWVKLSSLLNLDTHRDEDQKKLETLAKEIKIQGLCGDLDATSVYAKLDRVRKIREMDIISVTVDHELEDVVEIFSRLNNRGTKVTEADIYLGIVAAKAPGWVRDQFLPFLNVLKDYGFDISPNLLFKSLTAIAAGKTRYRDIPDEIWEAVAIEPAWKRCTEAWKNIVKSLAAYGVLSNDPMPTEAALVTLIALQDKFMDEASFDGSFYWFVQASRFGRYSGSGATSLDEDLRDIGDSETKDEAIRKLLKRFEHQKQIEQDEFMRDYSDARFGRFMLYLIVYKQGAQDWDEKGYRLGFEGTQALTDFRPQWHHIYPVKFLNEDFEEAQVNALANIAVIGSTINIRISKKDPMDYLDRYKIADVKLTQQFIPTNREELKKGNFPKFLEDRSKKLTEAANLYLSSLRGKLE